MSDINEWHKIGNKLTAYLGICRCQRKLKSIVDDLLRLKEINQKVYDSGGDRNFTGAEWALLAMLESRDLVTHGVNCEYPIIYGEFWEWLEEIKDNPNLEDN